MSNFYLCEQCGNMAGRVKGVGGMTRLFSCSASDGDMVEPKVMVDHGHRNGRIPYDEPKDVCPLFEPREVRS